MTLSRSGKHDARREMTVLLSEKVQYVVTFHDEPKPLSVIGTRHEALMVNAYDAACFTLCRRCDSMVAAALFEFAS